MAKFAKQGLSLNEMPTLKGLLRVLIRNKVLDCREQKEKSRRREKEIRKRTAREERERSERETEIG